MFGCTTPRSRRREESELLRFVREFTSLRRRPALQSASLPQRLRKLAAAGEFHRGFGARLDVELFVDVLEVHPHGVKADAQVATDFLIHRAFGQQRQNLLLAW